MENSQGKREIDTSLDRARAVDAKFKSALEQGHFPKAKSLTTPLQAGLSKEDCLSLFHSQVISRHLDLMARQLREKQQSFYTIGSSGHEGNAAIALAFRVSDMAFLHYRSTAFMVERAKQQNQSVQQIIRDHLLALVASKEDPISGGRHKVLGSLELRVPPQTSTIASHLPKALGTAYSIHLAKELALDTPLSYDAAIIASFGDASVNHSTAQGAFNAAAWITHHHIPLPIVFLCEDNGIGISVPTPIDWVELTFKQRLELDYIACDGLNFCDVFLAARKAEENVRRKKKPVFLHFKTVRLLGHAGSDIEQHYRSPEEIEQIEAQDPLLHSARILEENAFATRDEILTMYNGVRQEVETIANWAIQRPKLTQAEEIMAAIVPPKLRVNIKPRHSLEKNTEPPRHMAVLLNRVFAETLEYYPNTLFFGEDIGRKGGVYRVTAGLQQQFGRRRVFDTLLDEQTILGTALGLAHNGFLPIPEIQFLAYVQNAIDQIRGEAATLSFFSKGQFTNPMIIRIPGLAYQKGFGGHFHNDNAFGFLREIPGLIVICPSNGRDAVQLFRRALQLCFEEQRVVVFLEPIALYMTKDLYTENDGQWLHSYPSFEETIEFGEMGVYGESENLIVLTYGNGYYLCRQAEKQLREQYHIPIKIVDLRWLAPLNKEGILKQIRPYPHIMIVDESRETGSLSEALMTLMVENLKPLPNVQRIVGKDCFIPLGTAWQALLPSVEAIVALARQMIKEH